MTKILVIEDEMPVRANITELLEAEEFEVITAENGFLGVLWAQEHLPDLVICDVMMPELDGRDVLSALRQDVLTETVPFIFLTARADKSDIRLGMDLGADDYLTKPFSRRELLGAVQARLSKSQSLERRYRHNSRPVDMGVLPRRSTVTAESVSGYAALPMNDADQQALSKLKIAINLLKKVPNGIYRRHCLQLLQDIYNHEIMLLKGNSVHISQVDQDEAALWQELSQVV